MKLSACSGVGFAFSSPQQPLSRAPGAAAASEPHRWTLGLGEICDSGASTAGCGLPAFGCLFIFFFPVIFQNQICPI